MPRRWCLLVCIFLVMKQDEWLVKGLSIIGKEIPEQILPDGGHFERSPLYHSIILEDLLDLINLVGVYGFKIEPVLKNPPVIGGSEKRTGNGTDSRGKVVYKLQQHVEIWAESVQKMQTWLKAMCHPDREIAFFNDAAFDIAPKSKELEAYALRLGLAEGVEPRSGVTHLADSGYLRIEQGPAIVLIDVAAVGPDYLSGHAHADTLSFELSLWGQRVLINTGTSTYEEDPDREYQRGTSAHNTVVVNNENSSEVWSSFRVARRARPFDLRVSETEGEIVVSCAHGGYRRLKGKPVHRRTWWISKEPLINSKPSHCERSEAIQQSSKAKGYGLPRHFAPRNDDVVILNQNLPKYQLVIQDTIEGEWRRAAAYYHFHPNVQIEEETEQGGVLRLTDGAGIRWKVENAKAEVVRGHYHPEFGLTIPNQCLKLAFTGPVCEVTFSWD